MCLPPRGSQLDYSVTALQTEKLQAPTLKAVRAISKGFFALFLSLNPILHFFLTFIRTVTSLFYFSFLLKLMKTFLYLLLFSLFLASLIHYFISFFVFIVTELSKQTQCTVGLISIMGFTREEPITELIDWSCVQAWSCTAHYFQSLSFGLLFFCFYP